MQVPVKVMCSYSVSLIRNYLVPLVREDIYILIYIDYKELKVPTT